MHSRQYGKATGFALSLVVPLMPFLGYQAGSSWVTAVLFFLVFPILGRIIGNDSTPTISVDQVPAFMRFYYRWLPRLYFPLWLFSLIWTVQTITRPGMPISTVLGLGFSAAIGSACASSVAHELTHRETRADTWLARLMVTLMGYPHFIREHFYHHRHVGIPLHSLSARVGEGLWAFLYRILPEGLAAARDMEGQILLKRKKSLWHCTIIQNAVITILWACLFTWIAGMSGLVFFLLQAVYSIFAIQAINYVQHYGLVRLPTEAIGHDITWEDNCPIANCLTLNINHHSQHHQEPNLPYYALELDRLSPRLPASYMIMFSIAYIPALWRKVMDPRLMAYLKQRGKPLQQGEGDCLNVLGELIR